MKKIICAAFAFLFLILQANSQCTPDGSITVPGIYPDTIVNLPPAFTNALYSTTMQLKVLTDTVVAGLGLVTVTNIQILSVTGMPPGITYQCYQNNCTFPGGSNRCVQISGTATVAGTYPIVVNIKVNGIYGGFIPVSQNSTVTGYVINVYGPPVVAFNATPTSICAGGTVAFTDLSNNLADSWNWTFTGGTPATSTEQNPTITYNTAGTYAVTHSATNPAGTNTITTNNVITVKALPTGNIALVTNDSVCRGDTLKVQANSNPGATFQWYKGTVILPGEISSSLSTTTSGYYKVMVTGTNGCSKFIGPKILRVVNLPPASITAAGPTTFCQGQNVTLNANITPGITYQWKRYTTDIPNATGQSYTAATAGVYKVITRNSFGCAKVSNTITVTINCREGVMNDGGVAQLYPNPAKNFAILDFVAMDENITLTMMDVSGKILEKSSLPSVKGEYNSINIPTAGLASGVYLLKLENGEQTTIHRLMVE